MVFNFKSIANEKCKKLYFPTATLSTFYAKNKVPSFSTDLSELVFSSSLVDDHTESIKSLRSAALSDVQSVNCDRIINIISTTPPFLKSFINKQIKNLFGERTYEIFLAELFSDKQKFLNKTFNNIFKTEAAPLLVFTRDDDPLLLNIFKYLENYPKKIYKILVLKTKSLTPPISSSKVKYVDEINTLAL